MFLSTKTVQRSKSLHEQTYQAPRESILRGALASGDSLVIFALMKREIAIALPVSATVIEVLCIQRSMLLSVRHMNVIQ